MIQIKTIIAPKAMIARIREEKGGIRCKRGRALVLPNVDDYWHKTREKITVG